MPFRCFAVAGRDGAEPDVGDGFFAAVRGRMRGGERRPTSLTRIIFLRLFATTTH
jgi:hypothetical protein